MSKAVVFEGVKTTFFLILLLENDHIYQASDGNYYTGPRQDNVRPVQRPPNFLEWIVDGKINYSILIVFSLEEL